MFLGGSWVEGEREIAMSERRQLRLREGEVGEVNKRKGQ